VDERRYKELRPGQLRTFCECVRRKSFSAAGRALKISQPAVWQQVRALERNFGVALLQRRGRDWEPTEDGWVLYELAGQIVAAVDSLADAFEKKRGGVARELVVVGSPAVFMEELAAPIVEFCLKHPHIKPRLQTAAGPEFIDAVVSGRADFAVVPAGWVDPKNPDVLCERLSDRPATLAVPAGHALAEKRKLTAADIAAYPLILPERDMPWRQHVDEVFRAAGATPRVILEITNTQAARRYVSLGLGITLLPQPRNGLPFANLVSRPVADLFPPEQIAVVRRRGSALRPQARLFIESVQQRLG
jgi:DNA-binding transcriptional LysR family regulator